MEDHAQQRSAAGMDIARKIGTLVFGMVPAIIGGCVTYDLSGGSYVAVGVYLTILLFFLGGLVSK
jgi:hypothetical protein